LLVVESAELAVEIFELVLSLADEVELSVVVVEPEVSEDELAPSDSSQEASSFARLVATSVALPEVVDESLPDESVVF